MAESTLSIKYDDLQIEVGVFVGYNVDVSKWTEAITDEVDRYIQAGVRQFYYPPAMDGVEAGYEWSFISPTTTLETTEDDVAQDMPDSFGRIVGDLHFESDVYAQSITVVSEHRIQALLQQDDGTSRPRHAAIRFKDDDGTGQRQEIVWWPIPDAAYTLTYRYEAFAGKLLPTKYALGGMKHSELVVESCLAVAEQRANDERGIHWELFGRLLVTAIAQDRKNGARHYGAMSAGESAGDDALARGTQRTTSDITYRGNTW